MNKHVFVISDMHLGWPTPTEMSNTSLLERFFRALATLAQTSQAEVELVVNGDSFDFTLPPQSTNQAWEANGARAASRVMGTNRRLVGGFETFVVGCREILESSPRASVSLLPGNHDLELFHPEVQSLLADRIGDPDRVRFIGAADSGARKIGDLWIEHGNRFDPQNNIDYLALEESIQDGTQFPLPDGHQVVRAIVNPIKKRLGWIDLVHPLSAVEVLLPAMHDAIERLWAALDEEYGIPAADILSGRPLRTLGNDTWIAVREFVTRLVDEVPVAEHGNCRPPNSKSDPRVREMLIPFLMDEVTLSIHKERPGLLDAARAISSRENARVVVFGHTHCPKRISDTPADDGFTYYNAGSWCRTVHVPRHPHTGHPGGSRFPLFLGDLWRNDVSGYASRHGTYVWVELAGDSVFRHELRQFEHGDTITV